MCRRFQNISNSFPEVPLRISRMFLSSGYFFSPPPSLSLCWGMPPRPSHLWVITFSRFRLDGWKNLCFLQAGEVVDARFCSRRFLHENKTHLGHILLPGWGFGIFLIKDCFTKLRTPSFCVVFFSLLPYSFALVIFSPSFSRPETAVWK